LTVTLARIIVGMVDYYCREEGEGRGAREERAEGTGQRAGGAECLLRERW
jgi:hypothetical protein